MIDREAFGKRLRDLLRTHASPGSSLRKRAWERLDNFEKEIYRSVAETIIREALDRSVVGVQS